MSFHLGILAMFGPVGAVGGVFNVAAVSNFNYYSRYIKMLQEPVRYYINNKYTLHHLYVFIFK